MLTRMTEEDWATVLGLSRACRSRRGAKGRNDRLFLEALHYFAVHNITWRDLPEAFGNWNSVWKRFWRLRARPAKWRGLGSTYDPARFHLLHGRFNESEVRAHQRLLKSSAGHNFASTPRVSIFSRTGSEGISLRALRETETGTHQSGP